MSCAVGLENHGMDLLASRQMKEQSWNITIAKGISFDASKSNAEMKLICVKNPLPWVNLYSIHP